MNQQISANTGGKIKMVSGLFRGALKQGSYVEYFADTAPIYSYKVIFLGKTFTIFSVQSKYRIQSITPLGS